MNNAAIEEPAPIKTAHSEPVIGHLLLALLDSGRGALGTDLEARAKLGLERYGTLLMTHNGRDALNDLYQELLDALMYLMQYQAELDGDYSTEEFYLLKKLTMSIKAKMEARGE